MVLCKTIVPAGGGASGRIEPMRFTFERKYLYPGFFLCFSEPINSYVSSRCLLSVGHFFTTGLNTIELTKKDQKLPDPSAKINIPH